MNWFITAVAYERLANELNYNNQDRLSTERLSEAEYWQSLTEEQTSEEVIFEVNKEISSPQEKSILTMPSLSPIL